MKVKKKVLTAALLCCLSVNSNATGIPTIDIAALVQNLVSYATQLNDYSEMMTQTGLNIDQVNQLVTQYEQTMTEYEHTLNQIAGLKNKMKAKDYLALLQMIDFKISSNPQGPDFDVGIFDDEGYHDIDEKLKGVYYRTRDLGSMVGDVIKSGVDGDSKKIVETRANQAFLKSKMITGQTYSVQQFNEQINDLKANALEAEATRQALATDDESELQTLQFIAFQNSLMIDNMQKQQEIAVSQMSYSNQMESEYFAKQAAYVDRQLAKYADVKSEYKPVDRGYTADF